jgi:hypothetical protein
MFNMWGDTPFLYNVVRRRLHDETEKAPNADATPKPIPLAAPGYI